MWLVTVTASLTLLFTSGNRSMTSGLAGGRTALEEGNAPRTVVPRHVLTPSGSTVREHCVSTEPRVAGGVRTLAGQPPAMAARGSAFVMLVASERSEPTSGFRAQVSPGMGT